MFSIIKALREAGAWGSEGSGSFQGL